MKLIALPAFADNYIWLLHKDRHALVVDPGDSAPVLAWMQEHPGVELDTILVTHHHADHTGGLVALVAQTGARVLSPVLEKMPVASQGLQQGDRFDWHGLVCDTLEVPGHTLGHLAFGPSLMTKTRCSFVATPCFRAVVAACLKAHPLKCWTHLTAWLLCRATPGCAAPTSTPCPIYGSR